MCVLYSTISAVYSPPGCGRSRGSWRGRAWAPAPGRGGPPWRAPAGEWSALIGQQILLHDWPVVVCLLTSTLMSPCVSCLSVSCWGVGSVSTVSKASVVTGLASSSSAFSCCCSRSFSLSLASISDRKLLIICSSCSLSMLSSGAGVLSRDLGHRKL